MKERSASAMILLTALVALCLLLGWSIAGFALGGTSPGGKDGDPSSPEGPGENPSPDPNPDPDPDPDPDPSPPPPDNPGPDDPEPDEPKPRPPEPREDSDGDFIPDDSEPDHKTDQYDFHNNPKSKYE